jgi:hypothetical protein
MNTTNTTAQPQPPHHPAPQSTHITPCIACVLLLAGPRSSVHLL